MVNKIKLKFAIRACCLQDTVTPQLLHYYVKKQEQKELEQGLQNKEGMIIDLSTTSCDNDDEEDGTATTKTSPLTEPSVVAVDEQDRGRIAATTAFFLCLQQQHRLMRIRLPPVLVLVPPLVLLRQGRERGDHHGKQV